jgi:hypothetical protein
MGRYVPVVPTDPASLSWLLELRRTTGALILVTYRGDW